MQNDFVLWIAISVYAAHILEEYTYDWKTWSTKTFNVEADWTFFYMANGAVIVLGVSCAAVGWKLPEFSLIYPALMVVNAIFSHIVPTFRHRKYSPGLLTALLLFLPTAAIIYFVAGHDGVLTLRALLVSTAGSLLIMGYLAFLVRTRNLAILKP